MQGMSNLKKSHFWTKGTEAELKWVEECREGKKGKTTHNFLKEKHGGWRQKMRFKKTDLRRGRFFPELRQVGILNPSLFGSKMYALFRASWTTEKKQQHICKLAKQNYR